MLRPEIQYEAYGYHGNLYIYKEINKLGSLIYRII